MDHFNNHTAMSFWLLDVQMGLGNMPESHAGLLRHHLTGLFQDTHDTCTPIFGPCTTETAVFGDRPHPTAAESNDVDFVSIGVKEINAASPIVCTASEQETSVRLRAL